MTQLTENVFAVEAPEYSKNYRLGKSERLKGKLFYNTTLDYFAAGQVIDLPPGSWQLLCTTREASEEQARVVVGSSEWYFPARHTRYIDYAHPVYENNKQAWAHGFGKAIESLNSLLTSKGLDLNKNYCLLKKK